MLAIVGILTLITMMILCSVELRMKKNVMPSVPAQALGQLIPGINHCHDFSDTLMRHFNCECVLYLNESVNNMCTFNIDACSRFYDTNKPY